MVQMIEVTTREGEKVTGTLIPSASLQWLWVGAMVQGARITLAIPTETIQNVRSR